ncbi:MAG: hypothetical protein N3B13_02455 [Deltaproteobacteria bacterium]|nr:hypothetical protein [Deltaproteobacteria bacterium]
MEPWINKLADYGKAGSKALDLVMKKCRKEDLPQNELYWLEQMTKQLKEDKYRICGDIMNNFLSEILEKLRE